MTTLQKSEPKKDIRTLIQSDAVKQQMAMVLPKHLTADRMARVACTTIMRVPKLAQCTPESLLNCLMQCSQLGLEPDGRRAHLIPFENRSKGTVECTLIIDWKGLAELALRGGTIAKLHADLICDKDEFAYDLGEVLHHKIDFRNPRGEPYAAYAMAVTKTGEKFMQVMTQAEIEAIRDNSQGWRAFKAGYAKQSPWKDSPGEMWKKTVFRRLAKWLPLSPEYRDAMEVDDEANLPVVTAPSDKPVFLPALPEPSDDGDLAPAPVEVKAEVKPEPKSKKPSPAPRDATKPAETTSEPAPVSQGVQSEPEPPSRSFEEVVDGAPATREPAHIAAARAAMTTSGITEAQVLGFWNQQKKASLTSLTEIPEASLLKLTTNAPLIENVRKVATVDVPS